jgi:hypothetical protein
MPRPKPPCHVFNLVRTKVFARFELVAQSAHDDGPVGGAILIRRKSPASWLVRDAVVANFKLLDQDRSSNRRDDARAAHGFVVRTTPDRLRRINLLLLNTAQRAVHQAGQAPYPCHIHTLMPRTFQRTGSNVVVKGVAEPVRPTALIGASERAELRLLNANSSNANSLWWPEFGWIRGNLQDFSKR